MSAGRWPVLVVAVAFLVIAWSLRPLVAANRLLEGSAGPPAPSVATVDDTLGRGESLAELMAANGFDAPTIHAITHVVRGFKHPRTFRPGVAARFSGSPGAAPDRIRLALTPDSLLHLAVSDSGWHGRLEVVPVVVDTLRLAGVIESSLWLATLSGDVDRLSDGGFEELVYDLADVFAWKVDFTRDIQPGDAFRVAFERERRPDGTVRSRRFLAIELQNRGRVMPAIPYARPGGRTAFYDRDGEPLRGAFLRYPVPYRITSGFSKRRFHPVLKAYRRHQGIDYGAPYGTRVQATAAGTVVRAGRWGGYGRMVEIRHARGIRTRYAHLSSIAAGIRPGRSVDQGQVIGRVGATGLATGTHLHYEFIQGGAHRNPLSVSVPSAPALGKDEMADFTVVRDAALALLDGVTPPAAADLRAAAHPRPEARRDALKPRFDRSRRTRSRGAG